MNDTVSGVLTILHELYPRAGCALEHTTAHELLFATIMSAQTTDVSVNKVTSTLFKKYLTISDFANANPEVFMEEIRTTGFFRNKTKSVIGAANMLMNEFNAQVPSTLEELIRLPGVARKTANVVLGTFFGIPSGFVVDTHVKRLAFRMGFTTQTDPVKVEKEVMALFPQEEWIFAGHALILHGRAICDAKKPECESCPVLPLCPQNGI